MNIKEYLKQLSIVIFGILIAFWINNIGMRHKEHTTQKQVLSAILSEVKDNQGDIKVAIEDLDSLRMTFINMQNRNTSSETSVSITYADLNTKSIGYETAKYTGILKDINHKLVSEIVENYEAQNKIKELERSMKDGIFEFFRFKKMDNVDCLLIQIVSLMNNLKELEVEQKQLIEDLTIFLKEKS